MYPSFFGLTEKPFSITPDPRYLFLGARHAEALAHLVYGITEAGGFVQLTGEVGTGKTTIVRSLLARQPENAEIALILNPRMNTTEFVATLCAELGITVPESALASEKELIDHLNRYLLGAHARGKRVVLIVDEAQNLSPELLEQVRLLTNLETETQKLLQIILIGQPELREVLARNDLRQLAQRITGRYHLDPLSRDETAAYVRHRLRIAGATAEIFTDGALAELYRVSDGIPRLINIIGDRALLGGYSADQHLIPAALVRRAASEVSGQRITPRWLPWVLGGATFLVTATVATLIWNGYRGSTTQTPAEAPAARAAKPTSSAAFTSVSVPATPAATASPTAPTAAAAPARDLASVLRDAAATTGMDAAYSRLFDLWTARYVIGPEDACTQARHQQLACLNQRGGLAVLRQFNRPAVLPLQDRTGTLHQVVIASMTADKARLFVGDARHEVTLPELQELWSGDFMLLWKPEHPEARNLARGSRGEPVRALRQHLNQWAGLMPEGKTSDVFDESLETLVLQFQRRNGITADGIAGVQTQALLDAAQPAPNTPQLVASLR